MDKLSYALGMSMGNNFQRSGINEIDVKEFAAGVGAVYDGLEPKMTYDEAKQIVQDFFTELESKAKDVNKKIGDEFLAKNSERDSVKVTATGLQYEVITEGDGICPTADDQVEVHYTGRLIDGTVFDSSVERGTPVTFGVTQVIPGWVEALQMMSVGAKWNLFIPSELAYGPQGAGPVIGPDTTLVFEVELLKIIK